MARARSRAPGAPQTIVGSEGRDTLAGTSGRDVIAALGGNDRVSAGPGDDVVCLGAGNDALNGGAGDDLSVAEAVLDGDDSFVGGSGVDTARYSGRTAPVAVSLDNVPDDGSGDDGGDVPSMWRTWWAASPATRCAAARRTTACSAEASST